MSISEDTQEELVDAYLRDKLSDEEKNLFEVRILGDERLFAAVRERELFINGLKHEQHLLDSSSSNQLSSSNETPSQHIDFWSWLNLRYSFASVALIAVLTLMIPALSAVSYLTGPAVPTIELAYTATTQYVERSRSAESIQTLSGTFPMRVHFDTSNLMDATQFSISVVADADGNELFANSEATADAEGWVSLDFNTPISGEVTVLFSFLDANENLQELSPYVLRFVEESR